MKILMVCLGNICRSPLAEGIMRDVINKNNLEAEVDSAGCIDFHVGESPDSRAIAIAKKYEIDISMLKGRQFTVKDFEDFDRIYVMDVANYMHIKRLTRNQNDLNKVDYIMNEVKVGSNMPVADPYYGDIDGFENTYSMIKQACEVIAGKIKNKIY